MLKLVPLPHHSFIKINAEMQLLKCCIFASSFKGEGGEIPECSHMTIVFSIIVLKLFILEYDKFDTMFLQLQLPHLILTKLTNLNAHPFDVSPKAF
jgi:hypothetical protein